MRRLARHTLSVLALLLVSVSTASAECAWVFWQEATGPPTYDSTTWAVSAWETKSACEQALAKKVGSDSTPPRSSKTEVRIDHMAGKPRVMLRTMSKEGPLITSYTYVCLPDTVDPPRSEAMIENPVRWVLHDDERCGDDCGKCGRMVREASIGTSVVRPGPCITRRAEIA